jgi:hypothetical protein
MEIKMKDDHTTGKDSWWVVRRMQAVREQSHIPGQTQGDK